MRDRAQSSNIAQIVDEAINRHGKSNDALIPILLDINHIFGFIPMQKPHGNLQETE